MEIVSLDRRSKEYAVLGTVACVHKAANGSLTLGDCAPLPKPARFAELRAYDAGPRFGIMLVEAARRGVLEQMISLVAFHLVETVLFHPLNAIDTRPLGWQTDEKENDFLAAKDYLSNGSRFLAEAQAGSHSLEEYFEERGMNYMSWSQAAYFAREIRKILKPKVGHASQTLPLARRALELSYLAGTADLLFERSSAGSETSEALRWRPVGNDGKCMWLLREETCIPTNCRGPVVALPITNHVTRYAFLMGAMPVNADLLAEAAPGLYTITYDEGATYHRIKNSCTRPKSLRKHDGTIVFTEWVADPKNKQASLAFAKWLTDMAWDDRSAANSPSGHTWIKSMIGTHRKIRRIATRNKPSYVATTQQELFDWFLERLNGAGSPDEISPARRAVLYPINIEVSGVLLPVFFDNGEFFVNIDIENWPSIPESALALPNGTFVQSRFRFRGSDLSPKLTPDQRKALKAQLAAETPSSP
ncbi:hypothetical protein KBB27_01085 [Patescibacteria group bacterium]|nr:hypothetical protein [Patescibacteria group bacterium]